jgi:asparagine synthase (glutamine-hydrolysing)
MCGFTGFIGGKNKDRKFLEFTVQKMANTIRHRGPDDSGIWVDSKLGVCLAHRRLSVIDLSSAGHQPMLSKSGRFVMVFNGEVYNHETIRLELKKSGFSCKWRGHSDSETILSGFEHWGIESTLCRMVGMFAIVLWDTIEQRLYLIRDRLGEKPLYYGWIKGVFVFGSEIKSLEAHPDFNKTVSRNALSQYLKFTHVPAPWSIFEGIYKLEPGCLLIINEDSTPFSGTPLRPPINSNGITLKRWWSLLDVAQNGVLNQTKDRVESTQILHYKLQESVKNQLLSDVPLGAFLSGGVDSSAIVALMQQQSLNPIKTFTVGFEESEFDESLYAKDIAKHLKTDHHELFVTSQEAQSLIPMLSNIYDEPFADSSQIPTYFVCKAAKQQVTVALSGDGGDEVFGGYNRYIWAPRIWSYLSWLPFPARQALGIAIESLPISWLNSASGLAGVTRLGEKLHKLSRSMHNVYNIDDLYFNLISEWKEGQLVLDSYKEPLEVVDNISFNELWPTTGINNIQQRMMYWDSVTYMPNDILCKVDRAAMSVSLETRMPFLDHNLVEYVWRMPIDMNIKGNYGKLALREVLQKYVPNQLIDRPKCGFSAPVGHWLRGPLREWAEDLLDEDRLTKECYLNSKHVHRIWRQHLSGKYDWSTKLWTVLMFQAWLSNHS